MILRANKFIPLYTYRTWALERSSPDFTIHSIHHLLYVASGISLHVELLLPRTPKIGTG